MELVIELFGSSLGAQSATDRIYLGLEDEQGVTSFKTAIVWKWVLFIRLLDNISFIFQIPYGVLENHSKK